MVLTVGLWTNKGGVGKTTLNFHLSTAYAHLNPSTRVVVVDMCPQANLSSTLLTDVSNRQSKEPPQKPLARGFVESGKSNVV